MVKKITIKVFPGSRKNQVLPVADEQIDLKVYTTAPANENKANISIIKLLSKYLKIPKSKILIGKGEQNKIKTIEILS